MAEHLTSLHDRQNLLSVRWVVSVCSHQEDAETTTFVIRPALEADDDMHLGRLQADLRRIGEDLAKEVREAARRRLRQLETSIGA